MIDRCIHRLRATLQETGGKTLLLARFQLQAGLLQPQKGGRPMEANSFRSMVPRKPMNPRRSVKGSRSSCRYRSESPL
jgi:hypothetical protein